MNKIPPFNHQSKSEVEEVCIYKKHVKWPPQNLAISPENKYKIVGSMPERIPNNNI